jgi:hypothetical protein
MSLMFVEICNCRDTVHIGTLQMSGTQLLFISCTIGLSDAETQDECELSDIELVSLRWVVVRTFGSIDVSKSRIKPD